MTRALSFNPWEFPRIGTNLREPIPADPKLVPQFAPLESATPAERAAESAALIAEAGMSARHLGVPLTIQDFPRDPAIHGGGELDDPFHSSTPHFGLAAPRWRKKEGLPPLDVPGCLEIAGIRMPPLGKGKDLYERHARRLKAKAKRRGVDAATAGSSSSTRAGAKHGGLVDDPATAGPSYSTTAQVTGADDEAPHAHERESTIAALEMFIAKFAPSSSRSAASPTASRTTSPEPSTTTAIPTNPTAVTEAPTTAPTTKNKKKKRKDKSSSKTKRSRTDQQPEQEIVPTPVALAPAPELTSRKRSRRALELEDDVANANADRSDALPKISKRALQPQPKIKQEENEGEQPPKRRKRFAAPSPSPTIGLGDSADDGGDGDGDGDNGGDKSSQRAVRRSRRATRALATGAGVGAEAAPVVVAVADTVAKAKGAAARKRGTGGKRSTRSS